MGRVFAAVCELARQRQSYGNPIAMVLSEARPTAGSEAKTRARRNAGNRSEAVYRPTARVNESIGQRPTANVEGSLQACRVIAANREQRTIAQRPSNALLWNTANVSANGSSSLYKAVCELAG